MIDTLPIPPSWAGAPAVWVDDTTAADDGEVFRLFRGNGESLALHAGCPFGPVFVLALETEDGYEVWPLLSTDDADEVRRAIAEI